jgi:hypothetical protein
MAIRQEPSMTTGQTIHRVGFRKWYERELIQSHLHLVLLLLAAIGLLGSAEAYSIKISAASQLTAIVCGLASAAIGLYALRRYLYLLKHAEFVADQAVCRHCDAYAKWELLDEAADGARLSVRCRRCEHRWNIDV